MNREKLRALIDETHIGLTGLGILIHKKSHVGISNRFIDIMGENLEKTVNRNVENWGDIPLPAQRGLIIYSLRSFFFDAGCLHRMSPTHMVWYTECIRALIDTLVKDGVYLE